MVNRDGVALTHYLSCDSIHVSGTHMSGRRRKCNGPCVCAPVVLGGRRHLFYFIFPLIINIVRASYSAKIPAKKELFCKDYGQVGHMCRKHHREDDKAVEYAADMSGVDTEICLNHPTSLKFRVHQAAGYSTCTNNREALPRSKDSSFIQALY